MANYAVTYVKKMDKFLDEDHSLEELESTASSYLIKIGFFQHERLIHLLVTFLFAILDIIMLVLSFFVSDLVVYLLLALFTVLLIPYIFHYYFLENSVQKMYRQYELLKDKLKS